MIYDFGGRGADLWWTQNREALEKCENLAVLNVPQEASRALAGLARRSMQLQCTLQEGHIWIGDGTSSVEIVLGTWKEAAAAG